MSLVDNGNGMYMPVAPAVVSGRWNCWRDLNRYRYRWCFGSVVSHDRKSVCRRSIR